MAASSAALPLERGVKELETVDDHAPLLAVQESSATLMFERLARDPNVPVDKLERLIALQERVMAHNAESAFNVAFAEMQADIPTIRERARTDKTTYATLEDIIGKVRPILSHHGFTISHRTEWPDKKTVKVVGILTHRDGHARTSEFMADADQTGSKNAIQALGSSVSYGKRYTTKDLLCIVTTDEDDDGQQSSLATAPSAPHGLEEWWDDMIAATDNGLPQLEKAWAASRKELKEYVHKHRRQAWIALKAKAEKAGQ